MEVTIFDLTGQTGGGYSDKTYLPPQVTRLDLQWAEKQVSEGFRRALREAAPERWPAFRRFTVDDGGRLWIGLETPRGQPTQWAVIDARGELLCRFELPEDVEVHLVDGDRAFAVVKDELDVPRIAVYRWGVQETKDRGGHR